MDQPWALDLMVPGGREPDHADLRAGVAWCRERAGGRPWGVTVPRSGVAALRRRGWVESDGLPVLAAPASAAGRLRAPLAPGLRLDATPSRAAVVAAYGGWMRDRPLAEALVIGSDVDHPARRFLVVRAQDEPIGCALAWLTAETVALSGLGVVTGWRGRGVGAALVAAASRMGLDAAPAASVVWMHATDDGARLYRRMGFAVVDEHVTVRAANDAPSDAPPLG